MTDSMNDLGVPANELEPRRQRESGASPWISRRTRALGGFRRVAAVLIVADAACIVVALLAAHRVRLGSSEFTSAFTLVAVVSPLVWIGVFHGFRLYGVRHLPAAEEFRRLIIATTFAVFLIVVGTVWWRQSLDRISLVLTLVFALLLELLVRRLARWHIRRQKRTGRLAFRTLIIGTNQEAQRIAQALESPVRGFVPLGFISGPRGPTSSDGLPILGEIGDLGHAVASNGAECVFVASTAVSAREMFHISHCCRQSNIEMRVSANLPDILTSRLSVEQIHNDLMALSVRPVKLTGAQAALKRSFDLAFGSLALVLFLVPMAVITAAIRLTSGGPVLFRQRRVTKNGREFTMYKFRTMVKDPARALEGRTIDLTKPFFKLRDDPRLTRVGRLLRPMSLDELPQLWNVIRGDMSLVGPRPLPAEQVVANLEALAPRHEVRAGLTGWWQISGRSEVEIEEALRMDLFYIENWSLTFDLYILLKTLGAVVIGRGAY